MTTLSQQNTTAPDPVLIHMLNHGIDLEQGAMSPWLFVKRLCAIDYRVRHLVHGYAGLDAVKTSNQSINITTRNQRYEECTC